MVVRDNLDVPRSLAVLVDNRDLVPFLKIGDGSSNVLDLTTMVPNQDRVYVEVYLLHGRRRVNVHTFYVTDVLRGRERPSIVVSGHVRGETRIALRIDGELIEETVVDVGREIPAGPPDGRGFWVALLIILLAGIAGGGVWTWSEGRIGRDRRGTVPAMDRVEPATDPAATRARSAAVDTTEETTASGESPTPSETAETARRTGEQIHQEPAPAEAAQASVESAPEENAPEEAPPSVERRPSAVEPAPQEASRSADPAHSGGVPSAPPPAPDPRVVYFLPESSELTAETTAALRQLVVELQDWASSAQVDVRESLRVGLTVRGHTALYGNEGSRLELSAARATAVTTFLVNAMSAAGLSSEASLEALGGSEPVSDQEERQWENRRVEVITSYSTHSTEID